MEISEGSGVGAEVGFEGGDGGGGDEGGGGGMDEVNRRCALLEVLLRASRREALVARRARDAAEGTVREQRGDLAALRKRVSELEAFLAREEEAGKVGGRVFFCCFLFCDRLVSTRRRCTFFFFFVVVGFNEGMNPVPLVRSVVVV